MKAKLWLSARIRFLFPRRDKGGYAEAREAYEKIEEVVKMGMMDDDEVGKGLVSGASYFMEYSDDFPLMAEVDFPEVSPYATGWLCGLAGALTNKTMEETGEMPWCTAARELRACVEVLMGAIPKPPSMTFPRRVVVMHDGSVTVDRKFGVHDAEDIMKYVRDRKLFLADAKSRLAECSIKRAAERGD